MVESRKLGRAMQVEWQTHHPFCNVTTKVGAPTIDTFWIQHVWGLSTGKTYMTTLRNLN